jgi:hypothetical protein
MFVWCSLATARLALEAAQVPWVDPGVGGQDLDGDVPAQGELLRLVDDAHAAPANLTQDLVIPQLPQRRRGGRGLGLTLLTWRFRRLGLFHQHQGG